MSSKILKNCKLSILILILLAISCQNESVFQNMEGEHEQVIETFYSEELASIPCALQNFESDETEVNLVITKQSDLEKYFTCEESLPDIDFDKYYILAGMYRHHQCALFDSQSVSVSTNRIIYRVSMVELVCQMPTPVFYVAVIERKHFSLPVEFDVRFTNLD